MVELCRLDCCFDDVIAHSEHCHCLQRRTRGYSRTEVSDNTPDAPEPAREVDAATTGKFTYEG